MFLTFFQDYVSLPMLDLIKFHDFNTIILCYIVILLIIFIIF